MSNSSNKAVVPEAKSALDKFKFEVANEIGVPLKKMIEAQERQMSGQYRKKEP